MAKEFKRGSKKGGTMFPKYSLRQVLPNLKDLLSKTHTKTINIEQLNSGVFKIGAKSIAGQVRYSALKQFGLADGKHEAIKSTELASKIVHSINEEKTSFIRQAFFNVQTFKNTFETYQDSIISRDKIKGYVSSTLKVHPDSTDKFLESYLESAEEAKLCTINNDEITFTNGKAIQFNDESETDNGEENEEDNETDSNEQNKPTDEGSEESSAKINRIEKTQQRFKNSAPTIELKIDPTLDPDKFEKQLEILRKFGLV